MTQYDFFWIYHPNIRNYKHISDCKLEVVGEENKSILLNGIRDLIEADIKRKITEHATEVI